MLRLCVLFHLLLGAHGAVVFARPGENVTLRCFYTSGAKQLCWYRQAAGEQPRIVSSFYKHSPDTNVFYEGFRDPRRFSVHAGENFYHLNIFHLQPLDSAMFYCGQISMLATQFHAGILLVLQECAQPPVLQQAPGSSTVQQGASATLSCTLLPGASDADHRVYWFRASPADSRPGVMLLHEHGGGGKCEEKPQRRCVYTLARRNVTPSDAGTYYCAVDSCGEIVFGDGSRLDVGSSPESLPVALNFLLAALLVSTVANVILVCILRKKIRGWRRKSRGLQPRTSLSEHATAAAAPTNESGDLQYVALDFKRRQSKSKRRRRSAEEEEEEETVYSAVRRSEQD